jgi:membrane-associated phospholipid phosphatase
MATWRKRFRQFFEKNRHLLLLLYFFVYLAWFGYVEKTVTTHFHVIHTPLDDLIPFCEYFVIPYLLWFAYVAWGIAYFALRNKSEYYRLCAFLFSGMTIFLIVSTVYPNGHYLRPIYFTHHNFFTMLCGFLYQTDTATNLFPSIHVYNSLGVHLAVIHSRELKNNRIVRLLSGILATSIILSTMFIKQHSTFDVLTAFLLAFVMYRVVYVHDWSKNPLAQLSERRSKNKEIFQ